MRLKAPRSLLLGSAVLTLACQGPQSAGAAESKGAPRGEFSVPPSGIFTNSDSFKPAQNGLKQLEQDLFKPFETMSPKGSLDGAFAPPMPESRPNPSVQSKRAKELLERRRDWIFQTPEEILSTSSTDDLVKGRDDEQNGDDKTKLSPLERFYDRLYNKDKDKKDPTRKSNKRDVSFDSQKRTTKFDEQDAIDDSDFPMSVRETEREIRKLMAPKERKEETDSNVGSFSDAFGLGKTKPLREEIEMRRERMDQYKALVGIPITPRYDNDPLKQFTEMVGTSPKSQGMVPTMDSLSGQPHQALFGSQAAPSVFAPNSSLLPEGAQVQSAPSLAPALPKIEPPKSLPPPVIFNVPRRQF